jgi:hypothetical protein
VPSRVQVLIIHIFSNYILGMAAMCLGRLIRSASLIEGADDNEPLRWFGYTLATEGLATSCDASLASANHYINDCSMVSPLRKHKRHLIPTGEMDDHEASGV